MQDKFYEIAKNDIMSEIETKDTQKLLDKIQNDKANEQSLSDFKKLPDVSKYKECVHYGSVITFTDTNTTYGILTFETFEIYGKKFIFILLEGEIINCYELQ